MQCHGKPFDVSSRVLTASRKKVFAGIFTFLILTGVPRARAQASSSSQAPAGTSATPKSPALVDTTGPDVSLQNSEALFDVAAALNACGYDQGLATADPVRQQVRDQINQALQGSADARDAHEQICTFITQHRLSDSGSDLAQYISLALYVTPPPELTPSAEGADMPPDANGVENVLPLLRRFSELVDLHLIWVHVRPQYDKQLGE